MTPHTEQTERVEQTPRTGKRPIRWGGGGLHTARCDVRVEFGRCWIAPEDLAELRVGSVIELDADPDAPVTVRIGGRCAGRGAAVEADGRLAVRVQERM